MGYVPIRKPREEADKVLGGRYRLSFHEEGNEEGIRLVVRHCVRHSDLRRVLAKFFGSMESLDTVLRMLTPRRAGPVGPDEIGNGPDDKSASNPTSGSVTPGGTYENGDNSKEFLSTGRTGRRNALPDILGRHAETGLSDLSDRFEELSTDTDHSSSGQDPSIPGTSKQHG
ncbi:uncharacterized protein LOC126848188 [Cataglyphis hispanica]|uniref:uncharacterized protein LOC126848188 n=1 Tax=Cataglyphis hispanica TaxID=1086592 RepID=UPI0021805B3E|nr:uncharacterized protein LOC126848188 [Cataglyphis hispanica]